MVWGHRATKKKVKTGRVYRIRNTMNDMVFIGYGIRPLDAILKAHYSTATTNCNAKSKFYEAIKNIRWITFFETYFIELIEELSEGNTDKEELMELRKKYIMTVDKDKLYNTV
jgi:hypothetical protein